MKWYLRHFLKSAIFHALKIIFCPNRKKIKKKKKTHPNNKPEQVTQDPESRASIHHRCLLAFASFGHVDTARSMFHLSTKGSPSGYNDTAFLFHFQNQSRSVKPTQCLYTFGGRPFQLSAVYYITNVRYAVNYPLLKHTFLVFLSREIGLCLGLV